MSKITLVQVGKDNLAEKYSIPEDINWLVLEPENLAEKVAQLNSEEKKRRRRLGFNMVLVTDMDEETDLMALDNFVAAHTVFYASTVESYTEGQKYFFKKKLAKSILPENMDEFMSNLEFKFFSGQYGDTVAVNPYNYMINPSYKGEYKIEGQKYLILDDDFGDEYYPIISNTYNIATVKDRKLEFWLEYIKDPGIEIKLEFSRPANGYLGLDLDTWSVTSDNLNKPIVIDGKNAETQFSINISIKGKGKIKLGSVHQRQSRINQGFFLNGGQRIVDENRDELFYLFDPGDMKPPLNVYFSGYKSAEGFEGYFMLKKMKSPFILVTDTRLEGGSFYLGSKTLEDGLTKAIKEKLDWLGFSNEQLVLSGISMGAFGAVYYGLSLEPYAIILGKPLLGVGDIALNGRLHRPNEFDTALDVMLVRTGENSKEAAKELNEVFWDKFAKSSLRNTKIYAAYMKEDDYDPNAFYNLTHKAEKIEKVIGHGYTGRHNDNSLAIRRWFLTEYNHVLNEVRNGEKNGL